MILVEDKRHGADITHTERGNGDIVPPGGIRITAEGIGRIRLAGEGHERPGDGILLHAADDAGDIRGDCGDNA